MTWAHPIDVVVTFDHDAESAALQAADGLNRGPSYLSHGAFGAKVGLRRVLDVLDAKAVPATFFVPGWVAERWPSNLADIAASGHEIALHGYLHEYATAMVDIAEERMTLARAHQALTSVTGVEPMGYRPPGSLYSEWTVSLLRDLGFGYGSSMQDDDGPYLHAGDAPFVEIPCHWQLCDDLFGWGMDVRMTPSQVEEIWVSELRELGRYPNRTFVLTLHPHQIGHPGRLAMLERVVDQASALGARFRTCAQVAAGVVTANKGV